MKYNTTPKRITIQVIKHLTSYTVYNYSKHPKNKSHSI